MSTLERRRALDEPPTWDAARQGNANDAAHMASSEFHGLLRARNRQENDDTYEGPWRLVQRKNKTRSDSISSGSTTACPRRQASIRIKRFLDDF